MVAANRHPPHESSVLATSVAYVDEVQPSGCLLDGVEVTFAVARPDRPADLGQSPATKELEPGVLEQEAERSRRR